MLYAITNSLILILIVLVLNSTILLTKISVAQNEDALSYHKVCGLYFLAVVYLFSGDYYIV